MKSKHSKYNSRNPISNFLVHHFLNNIVDILKTMEFSNLLEVGCGEGMILKKLKSLIHNKNAYAIDIDMDEIKDAKKNAPYCKISQANASNLPFRDNCFDLILCCEVLEHLDSPELALNEIKRVAKKSIIISVPNEPLWSILNMLRGAYWQDFGNTPGHLNKWRPEQIVNIINRYTNVEIVKKPIPWTLLQCNIKNS